ncbi:hypothetical protein BSKO_10613 [Bryopsis sp. KO-2023]|nr:hypothetical protein BSKO_10613 [Bryopsis sp. KO-2023]
MRACWSAVGILALLSFDSVAAAAVKVPTLEECDAIVSELHPLDFATRTLGGDQSCVTSVDEGCCSQVRSLFVDGPAAKCFCNAEFLSVILMELSGEFAANGASPDDYVNMVYWQDYSLGSLLTGTGGMGEIIAMVGTGEMVEMGAIDHLSNQILQVRP